MQNTFTMQNEPRQGNVRVYEEGEEGWGGRGSEPVAWPMYHSMFFFLISPFTINSGSCLISIGSHDGRMHCALTISDHLSTWLILYNRVKGRKARKYIYKLKICQR